MRNSFIIHSRGVLFYYWPGVILCKNEMVRKRKSEREKKMFSYFLMTNLCYLLLFIYVNILFMYLFIIYLV